jgi:hypothetical protein
LKEDAPRSAKVVRNARNLLADDQPRAGMRSSGSADDGKNKMTRIGGYPDADAEPVQFSINRPPTPPIPLVEVSSRRSAGSVINYFS